MYFDEDKKIVSTKEVMEFVSILKDLPSDVALEVLSQYPEFAKIVSDALIKDNELKKKIIDSNQQNADQCFLFYQEILNDISKCLENESLTYEERLRLIDKEIEIAQIVGQKEIEFRQLNQRVLTNEA